MSMGHLHGTMVMEGVCAFTNLDETGYELDFDKRTQAETAWGASDGES